MNNLLERAVLILAVVFAIVLATNMAMAQGAQQADDKALIQQLQGQLQGRVSIPDAKSGVLIQPQGREWRDLREGPVKTYGGGLIVVVVIALCAFFAMRGRIKIDAGASNKRITRFNGLERFTHWLTAVSFVVLGLTGLNLVFGKSLLLPVIGPEAFTAISQFGKLAHNYLSFPFVLGILLMIVLWLRNNIPSGADIEWLKQGGGLLKKGVHPPAGKFNAGQKLIFWLVVLGGIAVSVTGYILMFPFATTDIAGMQLAQLIHAIVSLLLVAVIIGHIYIGSIGMEGAFDAMGSGEVDLNWAKEHHSLWVKEEIGRARSGGDD